MNQFKKWLSRPYPFDESWAAHLRAAGYGALFVTLFLAIFQPFGIYIAKGDFWISMAVFIGFGLITAVSLVFLGGVMVLIPSFFNEKDWTVAREIFTTILAILMIATANMFFATFVWELNLPWALFFHWIKLTFLVGLGPTFITVFLKQNRLYRRHIKGAEKLSSQLKVHSDNYQDEPVPLITLSGDNHGESLSLAPAALLYLEASDNYVRVFFKKDTTTENVLLRSTLKKMEGQLLGHEQFFRCHRTYLVNLDRVKKVSGNAQGFKLHLFGTDSLVPVSRKLNGKIGFLLSSQSTVRQFGSPSSG